MSVDKEPFAMLVFGLSLLLTLSTILAFVIRWIINYKMLWELIVAIILTVISGVFLIFIIILMFNIGKEAFNEIKYLIEIRKEEKESRNCINSNDKG